MRFGAVPAVLSRFRNQINSVFPQLKIPQFEIRKMDWRHGWARSAHIREHAARQRSCPDLNNPHVIANTAHTQQSGASASQAFVRSRPPAPSMFGTECRIDPNSSAATRGSADSAAGVSPRGIAFQIGPI